MNTYKNKFDDYDIVFIQEIRDESGTAFNKLCSMFEGYSCLNSSRAGRSSSKEQYGIIYKNSVSLTNYTDLNPDSLNRWERPPFNVKFKKENTEYSFWVMHTKPDEVPVELKYLETVIPSNGNQILLGDLNADCNYYSGGSFNNWLWSINGDTTSGNTICTYDNFVLNQYAQLLYTSSDIGTTTSAYESDHYMISMELKVN